MLEFILNQARRAQQQRHIKRGLLARKRAIESTPATPSPTAPAIMEMVRMPHLPENDSDTASKVEQLSQLADYPNAIQPDQGES
jgi:hypothetical protein